MPSKIFTNLEALGDVIGALRGIGDGVEADEYMEGVIRQAHGHAANAFNMAAAATAKTGSIAHMYEFSTPGITKGQALHPDPTSPDARLWIHTLIGHGGSMELGYSFRLARERNPRPTTADTGVASKYIAKLSRRKYVFWNKAMVMETGRPVEIKAHNSDFLFVPFYGEPPTNPLYNRGYLMWDSTRLGPLIAHPGAQTKGNFTAFWQGWWASAGNQVMTDQIELDVTMDIERTMTEATSKADAESMKPIQEVNLAATARSARAMYKKLFEVNTPRRRTTKTI